MKAAFLDIKKILPSASDIEIYFDKLWPICRSIVGPGFNQSLQILQEILPVQIHSIASGTKVFDWTVPPEWSIEDAYLLDESGFKVVDFKNNNLHVISHSTPIDTTLSLEELLPRLHTLPTLPDAIPYKTAYYDSTWGFCLSENVKQKLKPGKYRAVIKSKLSNGHLKYGEVVLPSTEGSKKEILISSYLCHPSMANNELSGPLVAAFLYQALSKMKQRDFNYRFVIVPETIGSISFLSQRGEHLKEHCVGGLVATCCGDSAPFQYKRSRRGNSLVDVVAENILKYETNLPGNTQFHDFFPTGSDERQYCSPGFNLPIGSITRSMYGTYKEYHTSLDNKSFISFVAMVQTVEFYLKVLIGMEANQKYINTSPMCEPMLSQRNLYPKLGATKNLSDEIKNTMYILNFSDGENTLVDIANKMQTSVLSLLTAVEALKEKDLLRTSENASS